MGESGLTQLATRAEQNWKVSAWKTMKAALKFEHSRQRQRRGRVKDDGQLSGMSHWLDNGEI